MIMENYIKKECSVHLVASDKVTNIRMCEDGTLDWRGKNVEGEQSVVIFFRDKNGYIIATSEKDDKYPQIGLDFLWPYIQNKKNDYSFPMRVYVTVKDTYPNDYPPLVMAQDINNQPNSLFCDNVLLHKNGDVIVSRCDEKEYTEKDVIMMLSYAVAHDKVTSSEMKTKVDEILNWFKSNL
jgi:hypothetical protein